MFSSYYPKLSWPWVLSGNGDCRLENLQTGERRYLGTTCYPCGWLNPEEALVKVPSSGHDYYDAFRWHAGTGDLVKVFSNFYAPGLVGDYAGNWFAASDQGLYINGGFYQATAFLYQTLKCTRGWVVVAERESNITQVFYLHEKVYTVPHHPDAHRRVASEFGTFFGYNGTVWCWDPVRNQFFEATLSPWKTEQPPIVMSWGDIVVSIRPVVYPRTDRVALCITNSAFPADQAVQLFDLPVDNFDAQFIINEGLLAVVGSEPSGNCYYREVHFQDASLYKPLIDEPQEVTMKPPRISNVKYAGQLIPARDASCVEWEDPANGQRFKVEIRDGSWYLHHWIPGAGEDHTGLRRPVKIG